MCDWHQDPIKPIQAMHNKKEYIIYQTMETPMVVHYEAFQY